MHSVGVIHGRFQVIHNDHLKYLLAGKARCEHLVVGITNPDPILSREDEADPARSTLSANPLTYFERYRMVVAALTDEGVDSHNFSVDPFPINLPELYRYYVPMEGVFFITICDAWGERQLDLLTGSEIRRKLLCGERWEHLGPKSAARLLEKWKIVERLRGLGQGP